ncbi:mucin-13 isoform X2 [Chamaea fasciata]|uniref:mucin-13 isoform X2 n=1 Tax=Chamaea fasciata TaxID=190680 RepID=UPI003369DB49
MRRSVLLAVWFGLVLSLLKEPPETSTGTTVMPTPTPTESSAVSEATSEPADTTASGPTDPPPETSAGTTVMLTPTPTESSAVSEATSEPTETPTSGPPVDFCHGHPCGRNSATCISLNSTFTCECKYGFYYRDKNCYIGKVFPANIAVKTPYSGSLQAVNSLEYEELFNNVSEFFSKALKSLNGYMKTAIVEIKSQQESRSSVSVNVTVTNVFKEDSSEDEKSVKFAIESAIEKDNQSYVYIYDEADPCEVYRCDTKTTVCQRAMFPECKCKPDLEKTEWDDRSCSVCSKSCSAAGHKYCVNEEEGLTCKCMTNFKKDSGSCVACPVGYSGEECSDNTELILIIVGTVLGAVILSLVIAVSIVSVRARHKQNPEKRSLIKPGYSDINTSEDRPTMFPRVQTTSGHANPGYQPNNPYEMHPTNRDHFPERDYDDLYGISREPRGFRTQSRY